MKASEVADLLNVPSGNIAKSKGTFTYRVGFFYTHGGSSDKLVAKVKARIPNAVIIDHGEKWKAFRGGDSLAQGSHWWVKFTV